LLLNGFSLERVQAGEVFQLHRHALILGKEQLVPQQKVPVERRVGAGVVARGLRVLLPGKLG
jgi:hypothetical protein